MTNSCYIRIEEISRRFIEMKKGLIWILTIGVFSIINTEMGVVGILPLVSENYGVTVSMAGLLVSMFALVYVAWNYDWLALSPLAWLFVQSLGVYTAFLSFQTLFFERFVACYHIRGNVGFFIVTIDFIGYVGTVGVLVFKELFAGELDWLAFYNSMVVWLGLASCLLFAGSLLWLARGRSLTLGGGWKRRAAVWEEPDTVTA